MIDLGSDTIRTAGGVGTVVSLALIALAVFAPDYYSRVPPGSEGALVAGAMYFSGRFRKEKRLKAKWAAESAVK